MPLAARVVTRYEAPGAIEKVAVSGCWFVVADATNWPSDTLMTSKFRFAAPTQLSSIVTGPAADGVMVVPMVVGPAPVVLTVPRWTTRPEPGGGGGGGGGEPTLVQGRLSRPSPVQVRSS